MSLSDDLGKAYNYFYSLSIVNTITHRHTPPFPPAGVGLDSGVSVDMPQAPWQGGGGGRGDRERSGGHYDLIPPGIYGDNSCHWLPPLPLLK